MDHMLLITFHLLSELLLDSLDFLQIKLGFIQPLPEDLNFLKSFYKNDVGTQSEFSIYDTKQVCNSVQTDISAGR